MKMIEFKFEKKYLTSKAYYLLSSYIERHHLQSDIKFSVDNAACFENRRRIFHVRVLVFLFDPIFCTNMFSFAFNNLHKINETMCHLHTVCIKTHSLKKFFHGLTGLDGIKFMISALWCVEYNMSKTQI